MGIQNKIMKELAEQAGQGLKTYLESMHAYLELILDESKKHTEILAEIRNALSRDKNND